ncbi:MAG: macro domain-containing protein [Chloroflexota bacterium]
MEILEVNDSAITLYQGDITTFSGDAIVNASNQHLAGGGGVDGAIHRAGGSQIGEACRAVGSCPTGSAVATVAGRLAARRVIHAVAARMARRLSSGQGIAGPSKWPTKGATDQREIYQETDPNRQK